MTVIVRHPPFAPLWAFFSLCFSWASIFGQSAPEPLEHTSSLGTRFVTIPGTPSLFATHETRLSEWQAFLAVSGYAWSYRPHFQQGPDHPVVGITLEDARAFCTWLTEKDRLEGRLNSSQLYRLPTRADWDAAIGLLRTRKPDLTVEEKVADERSFPWGGAWPPPAKSANLAEGEIAGYKDDYPFTAPVGQFKPSAEGLYDLSGNVWEWCWDPEIRAEQIGVLRGGSWAYFRPECLLSSYLYTVPVDMRMPTIGFRCVFEDKQRTAVMLAAAEKIKAEIRTQRREEITGGEVKKEELAAMKEKLRAAGQLPSSQDSQTPLVAAKNGEPFANALGMNFIPLQGTNVLFGSTEVRVQDFETWLKDAGRTWENKPRFLLTVEHPAVGVTWEDATAFCTWLTDRDRAAQLIPQEASYRLPSDLEWSRAAGLADESGMDPAERGQNPALHYPWSASGVFPPPASTTNLDALNIEGYRDSHSYTAPVTSERPNEYGIMGLGGNASEWCLDVWPGIPADRVIRGGSWLSRDKDQLRTGARQHAAASSSNSSLGFRVVLEMPAP
ncbi:sulfatase-modifying factor enzyme 1 [Prosthecobacter fusiformis]|uniref:Sulfatase-modifying factor enzyme 1 n=1 Tax=Prosthecobacter fusiformis TaxID=48464 RepID=A0A4R7RKA0_9BACT|nr:SUMF1/EgtB/PvdO family nonheme iron enzyme [Prosthecobacter fusiformis]TDU64627.1 sulfatase-modifying factor enzyme 1 [Prosthecobacter fusiformis]